MPPITQFVSIKTTQSLHLLEQLKHGFVCCCKERHNNDMCTKVRVVTCQHLREIAMNSFIGWRVTWIVWMAETDGECECVFAGLTRIRPSNDHPRTSGGHIRAIATQRPILPIPRLVYYVHLRAHILILTAAQPTTNQRFKKSYVMHGDGIRS